MAGGRLDAFMQSKKETTASCRIWTWVLYSIFYDHNCYIKHTTRFFCVVVSLEVFFLHLCDIKYSYQLGRSNAQRELNPFLSQAELPPPFWPLLFWVFVWTHENGTRLCVAAEMNDDFKIPWNKCGINLPFPEGAVTHSSTHIDICIVYHPICVCPCK